MADNVFCDKAFNMAKDPKYDEYQIGLTSMVYKFFDKKTLGDAVTSEIMSNQQLAEEVRPSFIDNVWSSDLVDIQLISKFSLRRIKPQTK